jgi:hypothetical protein
MPKKAPQMAAQPIEAILQEARNVKESTSNGSTAIMDACYREHAMPKKAPQMAAQPMEAMPQEARNAKKSTANDSTANGSIASDSIA